MRLFCSLFLMVMCLSFTIPTQVDAAPQQPQKTTAAPKKNTAAKKKTTTKKKNPTAKKTTATSKKQRVAAKNKKKRTARTAQRRSVAPRQQSNEPQIQSMAPAMIPVSVRGQGLDFGRVVEACLYNDNTWLLPNQTPPATEEQLSLLAPTFVTGIARFHAGSTPSPSMVASWNSLRARLQEINSVVSLDITLDLNSYKSPEAVTQHMQTIAKSLAAEAWTFTNVAQAAAANPHMVAAAVAEAKEQGRFIGMILTNGYVPETLDYAVVGIGPNGDGLSPKNNPILKKLRNKPAASFDGDVVIVGLSGSMENPGFGFAQGKTPSERRKIVINTAKQQNEYVAYAYPVFGPVGKNNRSYDATRDEFMIDTIRRNMTKYNPVTSPSSIAVGAME